MNETEELANEREMTRLVLLHLADVGFGGTNEVEGVFWLKEKFQKLTEAMEIALEFLQSPPCRDDDCRGIFAERELLRALGRGEK